MVGWLRGFAVASLCLGIGCQGSEVPGSGSEDLASAEVALAEVPGGVKCIVVDVSVAGDSVEKTFPVTTGTHASLAFGKLPLGEAVFAGSAFNKACPADGSAPTGTPSWLAEEVSASLHTGLPTSVTLDFWRNVPVDGDAEFHDSATQVSFAGDNGYAIAVDGKVYAWGYGTSGQLGGGVAAPHALAPALLAGVTAPDGVSGGDLHSCAWKGADVTCWGRNNSGQLGLGSKDSLVHAPAPVPHPWTAPIVEVDGGDNFSCALTSTHELYCWGQNAVGQLGVGDTVERLAPTRVDGSFIHISVGSTSVCAIDTDRAVNCWGANSSGQLGTAGGVAPAVTSPSFVPGSLGAITLATGNNHECLVRADGHVLCWGSNVAGELGSGDLLDHLAPTPVAGIADAVAVGTGFDHSCALRRGGQVWCWGFDDYGELGDGSATLQVLPVQVAGVDDAVALAVRYDSSCVLHQNGALSCWGYNGLGELGDGTGIDQPVPVDVVIP